MDEKELENTEEEARESAHPFDIFTPIGDDIVGFLKESSFKTPEELAAASDDDIRSVKGVGAKTVTKIRAILEDAGYKHDTGLPDVDVSNVPNVRGIKPRRDALVGPMPEEGKEITMRSKRAFLYKWEGKKYNITQGMRLEGRVPQSLIDEMVSRGEAAMLPGD